jgi:dynein heavy chain
MLCVQPPTDISLRTIFGAILGGFLQLFPAECKQVVKPIVDCSIEIYMRMSQELLPTPTKSHYTFNLRDVSKVFQVSTNNLSPQFACHLYGHFGITRLVDIFFKT